jgi:hypothetical protein
MKKRNIQADLSRYAKSQCKPWNTMFKNRNIMPDFPKRDAMATF